jgi:TolB-like protein/Tfp pilus assembly protein PilF
MGFFLSFVVEETLAGRGDRLKAFSIAREVYGRDETFDARSDAVVRVEAGRLRRRLAAYYERAGRSDPVRIDLPKGGYTPTFSWNGDVASDAPLPAPALPPHSAKRPSRMLLTLIGALVVAVIAVLAGWFFAERDKQAPASGTDLIAGGPTPSSTAFLAVLPLITLADDPTEDSIASGFVEAIITDLAKLSGLSVMAHASLLNMDSRSTDLSAMRREFGATHALRGSLQLRGDLVRVNVQLIDIAKSTTIWADRLDGEVQDLLTLQDVLADRIVDQLAVTVTPDENTLFKRRHSSNPEALALYRQALVLLIPPDDMERILTARNVFQRVIEIDPQFGGGYAGKGFSYSITVLFLKTSEPEVELDKGINLALKAIEIDPDFGMGYATLAFAYAMSGRKDEALFNARRAVAVQPGDAFTQFIYGMSLTLAGSPRKALTPLSEAVRLDPAEPRTPYRNVLGIAHFVAGDYAAAAKLFEENRSNGGPSGPHMDAFRASAYAELGKEDVARSIIQDLIRSYPQFPVEGWFAKWHENPDDSASLMENLYRLGLPRK